MRLVIFLVADALVGFGKFELDEVRAAAKQADCGAVLGIVARFYPGVDEGGCGVVDIEPRGVLRANHEFVFTGVGREHGALPDNREFGGLELLWVWAGVAEIEIDLRVGALVTFLLVAADFARLVVPGVKAAL